MNKDKFWAIIARAMDNDTEIMYLNLLNETAKLTQEDIAIFRAYVDVYAEIASETIWLDMACKVINGYVSDDAGLYFTLWVISRGEAVLLKALKDPDTLSELSEIPFGDADFEMIMGIGYNEEYEADNAESLEIIHAKITREIVPTIKFKDDEKYGGYASFEEGMEYIPNVLRKLIKRAESARFDWKNYI